MDQFAYTVEDLRARLATAEADLAAARTERDEAVENSGIWYDKWIKAYDRAAAAESALEAATKERDDEIMLRFEWEKERGQIEYALTTFDTCEAARAFLTRPAGGKEQA